jgi:hypothetical protein
LSDPAMLRCGNRAGQPLGLIRYKAKSSQACGIGLKMHSFETMVA